MVKNPPANIGDVRDVGSIPGSGRSPGRGHGNPLQYFCLKNPMDRGAWWATVHGIAKSWTRLSTHTHTHHTGCYHRSSWDLLSVTWPGPLSSQHLELSALHQPAFAATTVSLWNVSSKAKATTTTSTPQTLLLFSPFSFLNNTVSVLVQSFKKAWA